MYFVCFNSFSNSFMRIFAFCKSAYIRRFQTTHTNALFNSLRNRTFSLASSSTRFCATSSFFSLKLPLDLCESKLARGFIVEMLLRLTGRDCRWGNDNEFRFGSKGRNEAVLFGLSFIESRSDCRLAPGDEMDNREGSVFVGIPLFPLLSWLIKLFKNESKALHNTGCFLGSILHGWTHGVECGESSGFAHGRTRPSGFRCSVLQYGLCTSRAICYRCWKASDDFTAWSCISIQ